MRTPGRPTPTSATNRKYVRNNFACSSDTELSITATAGKPASVILKQSKKPSTTATVRTRLAVLNTPCRLNSRCDLWKPCLSAEGNRYFGS